MGVGALGRALFRGHIIQAEVEATIRDEVVATIRRGAAAIILGPPMDRRARTIQGGLIDLVGPCQGIPLTKASAQTARTLARVRTQ